MGRKEDIKQALKKWFESQDKWRTKKELATALGLPYSTVRKYFSEGRIPKKPRNRMKLYQLTHLRYFAPDATEAQIVESLRGEPGVETTSPMMQMMISSLYILLNKITKDVSRRSEIRSFVLGISQACANGNFDAVSQMVRSNSLEAVSRYYPEVRPIVEEIRMSFKDKGDLEIDELERKLKNYCEGHGIKLDGRFPKFIVDHLIHVEFSRKRNSAKVGILHLKNPEWIKVEQSIEEERKRVWGRDFGISEFYKDLMLSYDNVAKSPTGWVRLADIYREIEKRNPDWRSRKRLVAYYKDEFSADLSKLWWAQTNHNRPDQQIEFTSNRDPRLSFKVIIPDGTTASYGFVRPKKY